jgi:hypothetical protein
MESAPMRHAGALLLTAAVVLSTATTRQAAAQSASADIQGTWKLVVCDRFSDIDMAIVQVDKADAGYSAKLVDGLYPGNVLSVEKVTASGKDVALGIKGGPITGAFEGTADGKDKVLGTVKIQDKPFPARLERTDAQKITRPDQAANTAVMQKYATAMRERDPKTKLGQIQELLQGDAPFGLASSLYPEALGAAVLSGQGAGQVREIAEKYLALAGTYGAAMLADAQVKAARVLAEKKEFAPMALELAQKADKSHKDSADTGQKVAVVTALASAAKATGDASLAGDAQARLDKLNAQLDEEYHQKVPNFKPTAYAGRKEKANDRVALMELFTGAECPPCVAADVGFDGLIQTYKPTDVVLLQYHLHIPGPDPLTNADTEARAKYYTDLRGTPSTFFNGKTEAGGGGGMANSESKYQQYRSVLDQALESTKAATVELKASRDGDAIKIDATAATDSKSDTLKLRLALIEDSIRYVGGNGLRFHHHVVRAMPGGAEGQALAGGKGKFQATLKLDDLRKGQEEYLVAFVKQRGSFPQPLPPIDLKGLSVVAFVQDDNDRSVLQTAIVPLDGVGH